jgi:predicted nucleic acid-binding protein
LSLFDASALLNLVRKRGKNTLKLLKGNYILTLTFYEVGNALWKEVLLTRCIDISEANKVLETVFQ